MNPDDATDAWLKSLGVSIEAPPQAPALECGDPAPRKPPRHTEWRDTPPRLMGYCARVERLVCETCSTTTEVLQGVFAEERSAMGSLRYQALLKSTTLVPQNVDHKLQLITRRVPWCAHCIRSFGFTKEEQL